MYRVIYYLEVEDRQITADVRGDIPESGDTIHFTHTRLGHTHTVRGVVETVHGESVYLEEEGVEIRISR